MTDKARKIQALKELVKLSQDRSYELYSYVEDYHKGGRSWPIDWAEELHQGHFDNMQKRQEALDKTWNRLMSADLPHSVGQIKKERKLVNLLLEAGANPNYHSHVLNKNVFDAFLMEGKSHIALEIARAKGFMGPESPEEVFSYLVDELKFHADLEREFVPTDQQEAALNNQHYSNQKELVYLLFQQGFYPQNAKTFEKLVPTVLEKKPDFFDNKKQQVITQMKRAKTPLAIYRALTGRKEKR